MRRTAIWQTNGPKGPHDRRASLDVPPVGCPASNDPNPVARDDRRAYSLDHVPDMHVLSVDTRPACPEEAAVLRLPGQTPVHVIDGLHVMEGRPMAMCRSVCPADLFPELPVLVQEGLAPDAAWRQSGIDRFRGETRMTATLASALQAHHLGVEEGAPILRSAFLHLDVGGLAVDYGQIWFAGDRAALVAAPE
ncbi:GntR family transcriptional regulator [Falsirhodobacter sp. 20TX0035]|uniref:GntR family transcriptional regulator n=1 Tax=Falsirhodobacter sp. 20TX0035 TaxID=3022019 RepID=UPI00232FC6D3|nr:GntR family transcriptional regulator [Falsirhodobacter sp. 20TX0035]MDB6452952.1 GntR family transcriptional regulator [Falsirhodobacter sp. 20TX0035]